MILGQLILKWLPFSVYHRFRSLWRRMVKAMYRPLGEADMRELIIKRLGVKSGDVLFIHSSVDKLNIDFSPFRLLSLLLEIVGKEGTLLFPAWHFNQRAEEYLKSGKVFDIRRSPSALGLLSELARRHPLARRSLHPTTSIVAIGKQADYLVNDHGTSVYPCDETSPFFKMMEFHAKIIGLGVTTEFLSFVHCPEDVMKDKFPFKTRSSGIFSAKALDHTGQLHEVKTLVADKAIGHRNIPGFISRHISPQAAKEFSVRQNRFFVVNATQFYSEVVNLSEKGITIYT